MNTEMLLSMTALAVAGGNAVAQAVSAYHDGRNRHEQSQRDEIATYLRFAKEFNEIKRRLPVHYRRVPLEHKFQPEQEIAAHELLELFATEYQLRKMGRVPDDFWQIWSKGMRNFGLSPHGDRIWNSIRHDDQCDMPDDFVTFYNKFLDEERTKKANGKVNGHFPSIFHDNAQLREDRT
jgi:hypothetical protein